MLTSARLLAWLAASGAPHTVLHHAPATTAEEAAAARGTPLAMGGKSLVLRIDRIGDVVLAVGSDRKLDGKALRKALGVQRYRFMTAEELGALAGLAPGEVPPVGEPVLPLRLFAGPELLAREEIVFAAASRTVSVRMRVSDWAAVARPEVVGCFTVGG